MKDVFSSSFLYKNNLLLGGQIKTKKNVIIDSCRWIQKNCEQKGIKHSWNWVSVQVMIYGPAKKTKQKKIRE